jgi:hypothetical protein
MKTLLPCLLALLASALPARAEPWDTERATLLEKLKDPDQKKRAQAVRALKEFRIPRAIDFLVELYLAEKDPGVADAAGDVIALANEGEARERFFAHCRSGRKPEERAKLVAVLGRGGMRDTCDVLKALFKDPAPAVRAAALAAAAAARFLGLEPAVRAAAAAALATFRLFESAEALLAALEKEADEAAAEAIAQALAAISGQALGKDPEPWRNWLDGQRGLRVTQADVDRALDRASAWILQHRTANPFKPEDESLTLELYALVHAGVPLDDPVVKHAIDCVYRMPMEKTYRVGIGAMALFDISASAHQPWLARAAAHLLYNHLDNGFWDYGEAIPGETPSLSPPAPTGKKPEMGAGTKALKKVPMPKLPRKKAGPWWDLSNTQYAVLGLRACAEANVEVPKENWTRCMNALKGWQRGDGAYCYNSLNKSPYGSIHTSGLGAYIVCRYYAGHGSKRDGAIDKGIEWLGDNFSTAENPLAADTKTWLYYYYYGMERVGVLADTEFFGKREWYQEGARYLLSQQAANGSWGMYPLRDTSWAILFLRRATRPVGRTADK